jgi:hypothetical protein
MCNGSLEMSESSGLVAALTGALAEPRMGLSAIRRQPKHLTKRALGLIQLAENKLFRSKLLMEHGQIRGQGGRGLKVAQGG